ncbi:uncharacterized protein EHS24_006165 [Apiotrichum porosum]|uniref:Enoyl reductase (ER) domain-containing protein n=1 Tax=Apiotrichum porosum TaxID=105984 RepID=A0A427Y0M1_9TREE|nr:uncharacterized protein EHS24_006165 [Apiotrichum porosum]RSH84641.1 hypothetical protein EHS24_006165 [Apiotrichum porosum]
MKAAQIVNKNERYTLCDVPAPTAGPGQLLIQVKAAGFCHTDIMVSHGDFGSPYPITGSHEPAGIVVAVGEGVQGWQVGDRAASLNKVTECGECHDCKHLDSAFCPNGNLAGLHTDGSFAEYFVSLAKNSAKVPESMPWEVAAPMPCAGITIYKAIRKAGLQPGGVLAISGLGALGHIGVQMAKAMGLFVVGIDARPGPLELCAGLALAPDVLIDASKTSAEEAVALIDKKVKSTFSEERPSGVDAVVVTAEVPPALRFAFDITKRHGTYVLVSQPEELRIPFRELIFKNVTVVGSLQGNGADLQETIEFVTQHDIQVHTRTWAGLEQVGPMWDEQVSPGQVGKNVVLF